jgi:hypothetical protein
MRGGSPLMQVVVCGGAGALFGVIGLRGEGCVVCGEAEICWVCRVD